MTWQTDARALCAEPGDSCGVSIAITCDCLGKALDAGLDDRALDRLEQLRLQLDGAWSVLRRRGENAETVELLHLASRASEIAHAGRMAQYAATADTEPPRDTERTGWADEELDAVQKDGPHEHLNDSRDTHEEEVAR